MSSDQKTASLQEAYSKLLSEVEENNRIASPGPGIKGCKTKLQVSCYDSLKSNIGLLPYDIVIRLKQVYRDIVEENQYIAKIETMGFDRFRKELPMEWLQWSRTAIVLSDSLRQLQSILKAKMSSLRSGITR
jgi:hypothetical protein